MNDHPVVKLLGDSLINNSNDAIQTLSLCGKDKLLGFYYSAYWCPSCIAFTPELVTFYKHFKSSEKRKNSFEIVYVSSDPDEKHFKEHMATMPWVALPFQERSKQMDLARHYRVQNIPALIVIESETGKLVTSSGRACVMDDPLGSWFPWKIRGVTEILSEISLVTNGGENVPYDSISLKIKGLYFSAHWCPPCKVFTPILAKLYKKLKMKHKFEIVFVSSDRSEESFNQYFSKMPWLAVPYPSERCRKELKNLYGVGGIPSLIILDENNSVITKEGRMEVNDDPDGEDFPWRPKLVDELGEKHISKLNEEPCLILFTSYDDKELEKAHYTLLPTAEEFEARLKRASMEESPIPHLNFFYAGDAEICDSVRDVIGFGDDFPLLVILDIPNSQKYIYDKKDHITSEIIGKFVRDFISNKLTPCVIGN